MFDYEMFRQRQTDLHRTADRHRALRAALRTRRTTRAAAKTTDTPR